MQVQQVLQVLQVQRVLQLELVGLPKMC